MPVQQTNITALFANMYGSSTDAGLSNPRESLDAYRQIFRNIPQFADVVKRKRSLIGNPTIESDTDPKWAEDVNQWLAELPSIGEAFNPFAYDKGISCALDQIIESIYVDGSDFVSFLDKDGRVLSKSAKLDALKIHDPIRFHYESIEPERYDLHYLTATNDIIIKADRRDTFKALQFDRTQWIWGKPLAYHSEFVLRLYLVSVGAREQSNARNGSPLELTIFGFTQNQNLDPAMTKMLTDDARTYAESAASKYREAIANKNSKMNEGVDVVGVAPASMSVSSHTYGKDAKTTSDFVNESQTYLQWAASSWGYPLALIGMDSGGDGLGSQKYAYAASIANLSAATSQIYLGYNLIKPLIDKRMADERKLAPKDYRIVWSGQTLEDQRNQAEIKKIDAEAAKTTLDAWVVALQNLTPQEQAAFKDKLGI